MLSFWSDTVTGSAERIEMRWTDYGEIPDDRAVWKSCVVRCLPRTRGRTKACGPSRSRNTQKNANRFSLHFEKRGGTKLILGSCGPRMNF